MRRHWSSTTAIFGGTFDPPHRGHLEAMRGLFHHPGVKEILVIPSRRPPQKSTATPFEDRFQMTKLLAQEVDPTRVSVLDPANILPSHTAPDYTLPILEALSQRSPHLAFVIGADQLEGLHTWYRFPEVLQKSSWIVLGRKPDGMDTALRVLSQWTSLVSPLDSHTWEIRGAKEKYLGLYATDAPALSSSEIRKSIALTGHPPEGALPTTVLQYWMQRNKS